MKYSLRFATKVDRRKSRKDHSVFLLLGLFLLLNPAAAHADAGVPMIVLTYPAMMATLIPVVLIEAVIFSRLLKIKFKSTLMPSLSANAASAIIGFPLSWFLLLAVELVTGGGRAFGLSTLLGKIMAVTLQAAWLIPYEDDLWWMVPTAAAVGLIPAYFISVFSELWVVKKYFKDQEKSDLKRVVVKANLVTYGFLVALCFGTFIYQLAVHHRWITLTPEDKAIVETTKALQSNPNDYSAYYKRGLAYAKLKGSAEAIPDFNKAIALHSNNALVYVARGNAYREGFYRYGAYQSNNYEKEQKDRLDKDMHQAFSDYEQALKIDPNNASAYANRGKAYWKWKRPDQAIADLNKAVELDPNNADAYFDLGDMAVEKKDLDQALIHYGKIITFDPDNFKAYGKRGMASIKKGDPDQALNDFNKAIELRPKDGDLYMLRAGAYYDKKDFQKSWSDVKKGKSLGSDPALVRLTFDYGFDGYKFFENLKRDSK